MSFDTWKNTNDPSSNFVGIATTNSEQQQLNYVTTNTAIPSLRNTVHHVVVTTSTTGITVTMDGTQVLAYATQLPSQVLVGFTASTGGFNDIHQVQNVNITAGPPPPAPAVSSVPVAHVRHRLHVGGCHGGSRGALEPYRRRRQSPLPGPRYREHIAPHDDDVQIGRRSDCF